MFDFFCFPSFAVFWLVWCLFVPRSVSVDALAFSAGEMLSLCLCHCCCCFRPVRFDESDLSQVGFAHRYFSHTTSSSLIESCTLANVPLVCLVCLVGLLWVCRVSLCVYPCVYILVCVSVCVRFDQYCSTPTRSIKRRRIVPLCGRESAMCFCPAPHTQPFLPCALLVRYKVFRSTTHKVNRFLFPPLW